VTQHNFIKANWPAVAILIAYLLVGSLYAAYTPRWQAPDEPAHYNYIQALAQGKGFPIMEDGDYDQAYISHLTSERFPPSQSIAPLEYEDHQPPLYYLLATPVFWISGGAVRALRLFSVLLGGAAVTMIFLILREFAPEQPGLAWFGGGLVAFVPQYVAMMASINNDALTVVLLGLWLWLGLRYLRGQMSPWIMGGVAGLLLLTKTTGYGVLPLTVLVLALRYRRNRMPARWIGRQLVALLLPALLLGALWWGRNIAVYGWPDFLGLQQHDAVVTGQPRTMDWIRDQGPLPFLSGALRTTFQSFWGQFGWMGVLLDVRIYQGLLIFSALTAYGALWSLRQALREGLDARQRDALLVLGTAGLITAAMFLVYNMSFVQHQGRYLFPALPILALAAARGWQQLLEFRFAVVTALILVLIMVIVAGVGFIAGNLPLWMLAMLGITLIGLPLLAAVPNRWHGALIFAGLVAMAGLDLICLFRFVVPALS
jgi:4-amino-4-deoxy-L-arabinose transferase-like glycosyltransferase